MERILTRHCSRVRWEFDAAFFHVVKRKDEAKFGSYRARAMIVTIYHAMEQPVHAGEPNRATLAPPLGRSRRPHDTWAT